jgi:pilus assembly protein CpaE
MMVAPDASLIETVRLYLADRFPVELVQTAQSARQCLSVLSDVDPNVVLIAEGLEDHLQLVRQISALYPAVAPLVLSEADDLQSYHDLMAAGTRGIVKLTNSPQGWVVSGEELDLRIHQSSELVRSVKEKLAGGFRRQSMMLGREIITIYSPKGGVGKSSLATGLALLLAQQDPKRKVALVDLNLQFGIDSVYLNLQPRHSMADFVSNVDSLSSTTIESLATKKILEGGCELYFIPAPLNPLQADDILGQGVAGVLQSLRRYFDTTVVDTTSTISDVTLAALQASTTILLVCTQDMLAIRQTRAALELFNDPELGIDAGAVALVLNRLNNHSEIKPDSIESLFELRCVGKIPELGSFFETEVNVGNLPNALSSANPLITAWKGMVAGLKFEKSLRTSPE